MKEQTGRNICGARTAQGKVCTRPAGQATDHQGSGYCYLHDRRDAPIGDAKILSIVARDPALAARAQAYLNSDSELLNARRELAVLKARFEALHLNYDGEGDYDIPALCQLANTISIITRRIQDIEIARKHYVHIDVLTRFTADFSRIGLEFIPDASIRERFLDALEASIKNTITKSNARGIAARLLTRDAEDVILDVEDYSLAENKDTAPVQEMMGEKEA